MKPIRRDFNTPPLVFYKSSKQTNKSRKATEDQGNITSLSSWTYLEHYTQ